MTWNNIIGLYVNSFLKIEAITETKFIWKKLEIEGTKNFLVMCLHSFHFALNYIDCNLICRMKNKWQHKQDAFTVQKGTRKKSQNSFMLKKVYFCLNHETLKQISFFTSIQKKLLERKKSPRTRKESIQSRFYLFSK